ncbi:MAG: nucleoside deaminase [Tidjanibacter sp.]|nr:nucleoside deaminase [Tidjanibacter sp.]
MQAALAEARAAADEGEIPIGAVVVCGGRIVGKGHNRVEALGDATAHAEMQALTAAMNALGGKYLPECTIYVTVEPCIMCAGALAWSQIGRVVYGTADPKKGYSTYSDHVLHPKTVVEKGLMEQECREVVEQFFKKLRR